MGNLNEVGDEMCKSVYVLYALNVRVLVQYNNDPGQKIIDVKTKIPVALLCFIPYRSLK